MFRVLFALAALAAVSGLALGFLGPVHPAFDTIAHFRWHFALLLLALSLIGLAGNIKRAPFILMLLAVIGVWQSSANNRGGGAALSGNSVAGLTPFTLLQFNLRFDNPQQQKVLAAISDLDPDIVTLNEASRQWKDSLESLRAQYPHVFHCPEWQAIGGSFIFSKFQFRDAKNYCYAYSALGMTEILLDGEWVEIGVTHMRWPWPASGPEQLAAIEPRLKTIGRNAIIAGDFNATTWSDAVQRFARLGGMKVATGFGGTWMYNALPTGLAPMLGLPIDNVMTKGKVRIFEVSTLPALGSDHLPLLVKFDLGADAS